LSFGAIYPWFGLALTVVVCGGAFWKGDRETQFAAGGLLMSWAMTIALRDRSWVGTQWSAFVADTGLFIVLTAISLRTPKYWPLAAAGFQLLCVVTHIARMVDPGVRAWGYATAQVIFTQLMIVAMGVGVWNAWRGGRQPAITDDEPAGATRR